MFYKKTAYMVQNPKSPKINKQANKTQHHIPKTRGGKKTCLS